MLVEVLQHICKSPQHPVLFNRRHSTQCYRPGILCVAWSVNMPHSAPISSRSIVYTGSLPSPLTHCPHPSLIVLTPHSLPSSLTRCPHPSLIALTPHSLPSSLTRCPHPSLIALIPHSLPSPFTHCPHSLPSPLTHCPHSPPLPLTHCPHPHPLPSPSGAGALLSCLAPRSHPPGLEGGGGRGIPWDSGRPLEMLSPPGTTCAPSGTRR